MNAISGSISEALNAIDPNVIGVSILSADRETEPGWHVYILANGSRIRVDTANGQPPNAAVDAAIAAFDASDAAEAIREANKNPEKRALRESAESAIAANDNFLALANPTSGQVLQQVKRLTVQNNAIMKFLAKADSRSDQR